MTEDNPFAVGDYVGIINNGTNISFTTEYGGEPIFPLKTGDGSTSECVVLINTEVWGGSLLFPVSTSFKYDNTDSKKKTALRYMMDKVESSNSFTKTKAEIDALIAANELVAGALYEITGVHPTLYDDGTTSGTTVYLRAISGSELEVQGMGKFYNPKYNQSVDGFGIWDNKMYGTLTSIVGTFNYANKESVTANNAATGKLLADGMIQWVSGDWSTAISITGAVSGATANIAGFVSPSYGVGDKVIWGGYTVPIVTGKTDRKSTRLNSSHRSLSRMPSSA